MEYESSKYVPSRISLWCPVCGAREGQGCHPINHVRFTAHDNHARGIFPKPAPEAFVASSANRNVPTNKPRWTQHEFLA